MYIPLLVHLRKHLSISSELRVTSLRLRTCTYLIVVLHTPYWDTLGSLITSKWGLATSIIDECGASRLSFTNGTILNIPQTFLSHTLHWNIVSFCHVRKNGGDSLFYKLVLQEWVHYCIWLLLVVILKSFLRNFKTSQNGLYFTMISVPETYMLRVSSLPSSDGISLRRDRLWHHGLNIFGRKLKNSHGHPLVGGGHL